MSFLVADFIRRPDAGRADNGLVYFDLNDFDEAIRGPALWDA